MPEQTASAWPEALGNDCLPPGTHPPPDIRQAPAGLDRELNSLEGAWQEHQLQLHQALELQVAASIPPPPLGPVLNPLPLIKAKARAREAAVPGAFPATHRPPPTTQLTHGKSCLLWTPSVEPGPRSLVSHWATNRVTPPAVTGPSAHFLLPFPFSTAGSEFCGAGGRLALQPGSLPSQ